jgi:hypothetical protein
MESTALSTSSWSSNSLKFKIQLVKSVDLNDYEHVKKRADFNNFPVSKPLDLNKYKKYPAKNEK